MEKASMRQAIATVAGPRSWSDTRESWLARAARKAGITYRQCKSLWYEEISPDHLAARRMNDAAIEIGRAEASKLADTYETIARSMAVADADFNSDQIAALLDAANALRGLDRAGTNTRGRED